MSKRKIIRNPERANAIIKFMEMLPIVDGPAYGQRFKVDPFLEDWIRDTYEPHYEDTGLRVVRRSALTCARKNMKSYAVSGLLLCHLVGPEAVPNGQLFTCALDREQASAIFHMARKMIEMTPTLQKYLRVIESQKLICVVRSDVKGRGSVYKAISAEASSKHGLGSTWFCYDELGEARNDELLNVMLDGQQAPAEPMAMAISTQNPDPEHCFSKWIADGTAELDKAIEDRDDPSILAHKHAADEGCDIMDRDQWVKANPCLLSWKSFEVVEIAAKAAKRNPRLEQNFRRRYLNQQVSKNESLIAAADWKACFSTNAALVPGEAIYLAYDGAIRSDLAALVAISVEDGSRVAAWFFKPAARLEEHGRRDHNDPTRYVRWADDGWIEAVPGESIDPLAVAMKVAELHQTFDIRGLAYDRWRIDEFLRCLDSVGIAAQKGEGPGIRLVDWGQGFRDMAAAIDAFEHAVADTGEGKRDLIHDGNPVLTWCVSNAIPVSDPAGNRKLDKSKTTMKIDGAVALAMALGLKFRDRSTDESNYNPWEEDEGFSLMKRYA